MLNKIFLQGRLVADPELRHTNNGIAVASFRLAVDRDFKNKDTNERSADFIDVVAWRQTGEFVSRYFSKGRMALVEGRLQIRNYTDRDGNRRTAAEVVADNVYFGDSKRDGGSGNSYNGGDYAPAPAAYAPPASQSYSAPAPAANEFAELNEDDGELPF
jgi:single-strand DNA-binding protein